MDSVVLLLLVASKVLWMGISWLVDACCVYCLVVENQLGGINSASFIWGGGFVHHPLIRLLKGSIRNG